MPTLFLSDLHLSPTHPELIQHFIQLLHEAETKAEAVYILGDLFDRWIGDDNQQAWLSPIIAALKQLTTQIPCYFIVGNRDFLIGERFCQQTGITYLQEPAVIDLYGKKTLLMHGDLLCIDDKKYQAYRTKTRNPTAIKRFLKTPLFFRRMIAALFRLLSRFHQKKQPSFILDANQNEIVYQMQLHQVELLIYGHTHQPGIHWYREENQFKYWLVLGDWYTDRRSYLWVTDDLHYMLYHGR